MNINELSTQTEDTSWTFLIEPIIKAYNEYKREYNLEHPEIPPRLLPPTQCKGDVCNLLEEGTKVRIPLEAPVEATNLKKVLGGTFRATDLRYKPETYEITKVILRPGQPPMYAVNQDYKVGYTKGELQVVGDDEDDDTKAQTVFVPKDVHSKKGS